MTEILVRPTDLQNVTSQLRNSAQRIGGALQAIDSDILSLKNDKFLGNRANAIQASYTPKRDALLKAKDLVLYFANDLEAVAKIFEQADKSGVSDSCPDIWACQPPTPRLSCNEKVNWNDGRVSPRNKSFWCRLNASIVRVGKNGEYMTTQPFLPTEDARAHLHWKRIRQHVHRFMVIDVVLEDEFNDHRFFIVDVTISRFVEEITELHRRTPIIEVAAGHCPDRGQVHHRKRQSMPVALLGSSWSSRRRVFL